MVERIADEVRLYAGCLGPPDACQPAGSVMTRVAWRYHRQVHPIKGDQPAPRLPVLPPVEQVGHPLGVGDRAEQQLKLRVGEQWADHGEDLLPAIRPLAGAVDVGGGAHAGRPEGVEEGTTTFVSRRLGV